MTFVERNAFIKLRIEESDRETTEMEKMKSK